MKNAFQDYICINSRKLNIFQYICKFYVTLQYGQLWYVNVSWRYLLSFSAYTMAKYGMSMCVLGMAEEFKEDGIAVNALWPKFSVYYILCHFIQLYQIFTQKAHQNN